MTVTISEKTSEDMKLVVRRLQTRDVFTLLGLISQNVGTAEEVKKLFADVKLGSNDDNDIDSDGNSSFMATGISTVWGIVRGLLKDSRSEMVTWLASLVGKTEEEFDKLPPSALLDLLAALRKHDDLLDFFGRLQEAWSLFGEETQSPDQKTPNNTSPVLSIESKPATAGTMK